MNIILLCCLILILFILSFIFFLYSNYQRSFLPLSIPLNATPSENIVYCNDYDVLNAYIFDLPDKPNCPEWVNNLYVKKSLLYERQFTVSSNCCFYDVNNYKLINIPYILVGDINEKLYNDEELNLKPYIIENQTISYITPVCQAVSTCISLVLAYVFQETNRAIYKLYNLEGFLNTNPPINNVYNTSLTLDFYFEGYKCIEIRQVNQILASVINGKLQLNNSNVSQIVIIMVNIANNSGFQSISGINPPASQFAFNTLTSIVFD